MLTLFFVLVRCIIIFILDVVVNLSSRNIKYIVFILFCFVINNALAKWNEQCFVYPKAIRHIVDEANQNNNQAVVVGNNKNLPVEIHADKSTFFGKDFATFSGHVFFQQGMRKIYAENADVDYTKNSFSAKDEVYFYDRMLVLKSDHLDVDFDKELAIFTDADYWLLNNYMQGYAKKITTTKNNVLLEDAVVTTCSPSSFLHWDIISNTVDVNLEEEYAKIKHGRLRVYDIPIFYLPYFSFPISDKRTSGFLMPSYMNDEQDGFHIRLPYYWNIAPNYDMEIIPNIMTERGLYMQFNTRYLTHVGRGDVKVEFIPHDALNDVTDTFRYLYSINHSDRVNEHNAYYLRYADVGDHRYFYDFDSSLYSPDTNNRILREFVWSYDDTKWNAKVSWQQLHVLADVRNKPYEKLPEIDFLYYDSFSDLWDVSIFSELVYFNHPEKEHLRALRFHVEPKISIPYQTDYSLIEAEVGLYQTIYYQENIENDLLEDFVSRTLPVIKLSASLDFQKDLWINEKDYLLFFEPKVQYLYVPKKEQSNIGLYDTALLNADSYSVFREKKFSGLDRISAENQISLGFSSNLLNHKGKEIFSFSVGRAFYFNDANKIQSLNNVDSFEILPVFVVESYMLFTDRLSLYSTLDFNSDNYDLYKGDALMNYAGKQGHLQLSYRYVSALKYFVEANNSLLEQNAINQIALRLSANLSQQYAMMTNYYYDLSDSRKLDFYAGLQYESCCWYANIGYFNYLDTSNNAAVKSEQFKSGFAFQFFLNGLGNISKRKPQKKLKEGLVKQRVSYYR